VGVLPPMHELAKMAGLDLPEFLGKIASAQTADSAEGEPPEETE